jgi:serine/threonine protein kinase
VDEVLSRPVVVDVLPIGDPRTNHLFDAARRAAAAADPRFLRVLDCDMHDGVTYCVREWAGGRPLERMLGAGPLTGQQAGWMAREVSEALENLHRTGLAHGSIGPATVVVTDAGAIKVVGLATEAALRSTGPGSPEQDVRALGELLYASLTGRWPGPAPAWGLQPAPVEHGRLLSPRQVRAGVPRSLDDIADRLLGDPPRHHAVAINSAAGLSAALSGVIGSSHEPPSQMSDETVAVARQNGSVDDATVVVPPVQLPPALDPGPPGTTPGPARQRLQRQRPAQAPGGRAASAR